MKYVYGTYFFKTEEEIQKCIAEEEEKYQDYKRYTVTFNLVGAQFSVMAESREEADKIMLEHLHWAGKIAVIGVVEQEYIPPYDKEAILAAWEARPKVKK